ncbi:MAG TPA: heat-inducible transcriptional repressor HrcA [Terriglobia bacterium]|nr:heat-inducible transcriptional repressor HrcA [Terriglobia bacterium]
MTVQKELEKRQRDVLVAIIRRYISRGAPVGSKALSDRVPESLSSATIRSCMAELERCGFLEQPHVSAGRVPTDKAYRFYVDHLMSSARLEPATERYIDESLISGNGGREQLLTITSHLLSEISHNVGLVLGTTLEEKVLEHVKFVKLPDQRVLAVIVSKPDVIENRVIPLTEKISQAELDRTADYMNKEFRGWSLGTIRVEIFKRMEEMKELCDRMISNVARLLMWGALAGEESCPLFVDGTANILNLPEFEDGRKIKDLFETLEEKAKLIKILNACLQSHGRGVKILIGRENLSREMHECSLILAPYYYRNRVVGALGVVGPRRMKYDRAIPTVNYVAHACTRLLDSN